VKLIRKKKSTVADNVHFVSLVQLMQDDSNLRDKLLPLMALDSFNRKSALNSWLEELKLQRAPTEIISALACLVDDAIAAKILEISGE
jgi:hypothetical protein